MLPKNKLILQSFLSGILMGLAPAPFNAWYFAWFALAPLWILIRQQKSLQQIAILALAWGIGYDGLALFWITGVHPMTWMGVPWLASLAIAIFCWVFITLWGAGVVVTWAVLFSLITNKLNNKNVSNSLIKVLIGAALWCGLETLWSHTPLWWPAIAYTQSPHNLIILQLGKLSGVNTVAVVIIMVNGLLAETFLAWHKYTSFKSKILLITAPLVILIISHLLGFYFAKDKDSF